MVDITYRTLGPWGSGKGANLHPAEVDNNFYSLAQAIVDLLANPVPPNGIDSISVSGTQMTIYLTDGTALGPYTLPVLTFRWRGEFEANTYAELDAFTVSHGNTEVLDPDTVSYGVYMVLIPGTYTLFDQNEQVDGEYAFKQLFGSTDNSLSTLGDVIVTDPIPDQDILRWNAGAGRWMNSFLGTMAVQNADAVVITGGLFHNLGNPVLPGDAVNKAYVDALPAGMTIAPGLMMANASGLLGPAIGTTLSDYLDYALVTSARGTLLYRGASGWVALSPGTSGHFLRTAGAGADPTWAVGGAGVTSITAGAGIDTTPDTITSSGTVALAPIADRALLANITGASAAPVSIMLSAYLDVVLGNARGSLLTRTIGGWVALAPGTIGQYLRSGGAGNDLGWDSPAGAGTVTSVSAGTGISTGAGPITGAGAVSLAAIASLSLLANTSGASAAPVPTTVSALLDAALSATQGAVLYRGASGWAGLAPGTSGQVLTTSGASANPAWANAAAGAPIANLNLLANISGASAAASGNTLSNILDAVIGSSRGTLLYRGASGWVGLAPGTAGQYLQTAGTAGDPQWATVTTGGGSSGLSGMVAGQIPIAADATTVTSSANLSGDVSSNAALVTTIGANAVTTAKIANSAVTFGKVQNLAASRLLGNPTGSAAAPSEISLGAGLSFSGSTIVATVSSTGLTGMTAGQIPIAATATTVTSSGNLSGDVSTSGSLAATVTRIQGQPVSATAPTGTQVLQWSGSAWTPTTIATYTAPSATTKSTSYTATAGDLGNTLIMGGASVTLTLPAGIFTPGKTLQVSVTASTSCAITNNTGLTMAGLQSTSLFSGSSGTFIANADGTTLNFVPGLQPPTTTGLGGVRAQAASASFFLTGVDNTGGVTRTQVGFSNLSGTATVAQGGTGATSLPLTAAGAYGLTRTLLSTTGTATSPISDTSGTVGSWYGGVLSVLGLATQGNLELGRSNGTFAAPTAVLNGEGIGAILWNGTFAGNWCAAPRLAITGVTTEAWTSTANGTALWISTTLAGTLTTAVRVSIGTGLVVGAPTGGDKGSGTINAVSVSANNTVLTSDARLKRDIEDIPQCLDLVAAVAPKSYRWKPLDNPDGGPVDFADRIRWGFIAQEVEAAANKTHTPFAGVEGDEELGLDTGALIATLWQAVRELSAKVESLEDMLTGAAR